MEEIIELLFKKIYIIGGEINMNFKIQIPNQPSKKFFAFLSSTKFRSQSFTLIEILTTIAIFSLILGMISSLFAFALRAQKKSLASQELLRQTSYAMEYMGRQLRMAKREGASGACLSLAGRNYEYEEGINRMFGGEEYRVDYGIKFINHEGECCKFFLGQRVDGSDYCSLRFSKDLAYPEYLISDDFEVEEFNINLIEAEGIQPRVTLFLKIKGKGERVEDQPMIEIQTTISQRDLNMAP